MLTVQKIAQALRLAVNTDISRVCTAFHVSESVCSVVLACKRVLPHAIRLSPIIGNTAWETSATNVDRFAGTQAITAAAAAA